MAFNFEAAIREYKAGRELGNIVLRMKGTRSDYLKLYNWVKFGRTNR